MEELIMICNNCGQTVPDGIKSCPHCGTTYIYTEEPINAAPFNSAAENPVVKKFNAVFSDKLFLAAGVLIAVKTGISFLLGSVDVISLLFAIFLLITYFKAKNGALTSDHLRYTSGCVFAKVILNWVCVGLFAVGAILLTLCAGLLYFTFMESAAYSADAYSYGAISPSMNAFFPILYIGCAVIYFILAVGFVVSNLIFYRPAHKFAKALYTDYQNGVSREYNAKKISVWLMVMAIANLVIMVFSILITVIMMIAMKYFMPTSDMFSSMYYLIIILSVIQAFVMYLPGAAAFLSLSVWIKKRF